MKTSRLSNLLMQLKYSVEEVKVGNYFGGRWMRGWWHIELGACRACIIRPTASKRALSRICHKHNSAIAHAHAPMRPRTPINCRFYQRSMSRFVIFWLLLRGRSYATHDAARRPSPPPHPAASAECVRPTPCSVFRISRIPLYVVLCIIDACTSPQSLLLPLPLCPLHSSHSLVPRSRGQCLVSVSPASRCRWLRRIKILKCVRNCYTLV